MRGVHFFCLGVLISPEGSNDYSQANVQVFRSSGVTSEQARNATEPTELLNRSYAASEPLYSS